MVPEPPPIPEPVEGPVPEPVEGPVPEPVEGPIPEPVEGPIPEPVEGPVPEPVEGPVPEPVEGVWVARGSDAALAAASELPGVPDAFQRLWTPHRMAYIQAGVEAMRARCPFCAAPELTDDEGLIVHRGETCYVLLNLFPYNSGHLLVCPYRHVGLYDEATDAEVTEMAALTQTGMRVLRGVSACDGFNLGMNQGRVAGAGVDEHLHQHIVPRWATDANFFPIVARTKALPQLLGDVREAVAAAWPP